MLAFAIHAAYLAHKVVASKVAAFTIVGFKDWKHATGKNGILTGLNNCITHKQSEAISVQY